MDATFFRKGDRVRLVRMADPYDPVPAGSLGTVTGTCPPPINVVDVDWDCGRGLNACLDEDVIELVSREGGGGRE